MVERLTMMQGVHHTARPTWKLKETVAFYRDVMGLPIVHAVAARGWGADDHPDFLHFFFGSGRGSRIAFFYYLAFEPPIDAPAPESWLYRSMHTAWAVESREALLAWKARFEERGYDVLQVRHEVIESIYVTDPNGYMVELTWQVRDMTDVDGLDATLTLDAAIALEDERGERLTNIECVWRRKADVVAARLKRAA